MAQLLLLDPQFVHCVEMDALDDESFAEAAAFAGLGASSSPPRGPHGQRDQPRASLAALQRRGLRVPARRRGPPATHPTAMEGAGRLAAEAAGLAARGLKRARPTPPPPPPPPPPPSSSSSSPGTAVDAEFAPLTETEAEGPLAELMAMELLFRRQVCGL